jgi:hypothetical protein
MNTQATTLTQSETLAIATFCAASYAVGSNPLPHIRTRYGIPAIFGESELLPDALVLVRVRRHMGGALYGVVYGDARASSLIQATFSVIDGKIAVETNW